LILDGIGGRLSLAVLVGGLVFSTGPAGFPGSARAEEQRAAPGGEHHDHHHHAAIEGTAPLPDRSVYQLGGAWTDQNGRPFRLERLRGSPVVALMFYGTCKQAYPILVEDLKRLDALLAPAARERTRYLLVSFDPSRDTPARLAAYARERGLDPARWTLLHGAPEQVRELAMVLGVRYRPTGDGEFNHTMRITLLDRDGVAVERVDGLRQPLEALAKTLAGL
jgi:protein SCO1/2